MSGIQPLFTPVRLGLAAALWTGAVFADAPTSPQGEVPAEILARMGWFDGACAVFSAGAVKTGDRVSVIFMDSQTQAIGTVAPQGSDLESTCNALKEGRGGINRVEGVEFHRIEFTEKPGAQGIAFAGTVSGLKAIPGGVRVSLDGDASARVLTACATGESLAYDLWPAAPYEGEAAWSASFYLGYDVDRTCP